MKIAYEVNGDEKTLTARGLNLASALSLIPDHGRLLGVRHD